MSPMESASMPWLSERTTVSGRLIMSASLLPSARSSSVPLYVRIPFLSALPNAASTRLGVFGAHKEFEVVERFGADGVGHGRGDAALLHAPRHDVAHIGRQRQIGVAADYDKYDSCEQCQDMLFKELENPHSASLLSWLRSIISLARLRRRTISWVSVSPNCSRKAAVRSSNSRRLISRSWNPLSSP